MLDHLGLGLSDEDKAHKKLVFQKLQEHYRDYRDPWGFNLETVEKALDVLYPIYNNYFKVRVFGAENIKDEPYIFVSNHTGQIPIDGALITMATAMETEPPRILHSMVERFMAKFPFLGDFSAQTGSILGDRENCKWLLNNKESILVFPEGVRGISKSTSHFYELQQFTNGFYRIALSTKTKIVPVTVVGAEEMFPLVVHARKAGRALGLPTLPISANLFPLPSPIDIYFGEPIEVPEDLDSEAMDKDIRPKVYEIENVIKEQLRLGIENKRPFLEPLKKPLESLIKLKDLL
ncbi:MAG: acyltransferase family protein [Bacteriovoracaceae bacterium]|nr:acyltransferase family protein [Bacteriovoracaceae bacterium]